MGGTFHLKLSIHSSPIENKYREGKVQSTLERELNVPETAEVQAGGTCPGPRGSVCLLWLSFRNSAYAVFLGVVPGRGTLLTSWRVSAPVRTPLARCGCAPSGARAEVGTGW